MVRVLAVLHRAAVEPTEERLTLARDVMAAARGYVACPAVAWIEDAFAAIVAAAARVFSGWGYDMRTAECLETGGFSGRPTAGLSRTATAAKVTEPEAHQAGEGGSAEDTGGSERHLRGTSELGGAWSGYPAVALAAAVRVRPA